MIDGPDPLSRRTLLSYQQDLTGREVFLTVRSTFRRVQPIGDLGLKPAAEPSERRLVFHCMVKPMRPSQHSCQHVPWAPGSRYPFHF